MMGLIGAAGCASVGGGGVTKAGARWDAPLLFGGVPYYHAQNAGKAESICEKLARFHFSGPVIELGGRYDAAIKTREAYLAHIRAQIDALGPWLKAARARDEFAYVIFVNSNTPLNGMLKDGDLEGLLDYLIHKHGTSGVLLLPVSESDAKLPSGLRSAFVRYAAGTWPVGQLATMDSPHVGAWTEYHLKPHGSAPKGFRTIASTDQPDTLTLLPPDPLSNFQYVHTDGVRGVTPNISHAVEVFTAWKKAGYSRVWYDFSPTFNDAVHEAIGKIP